MCTFGRGVLVDAARFFEAQRQHVNENLKSFVRHLPGLSAREQQITHLACAGLSNKMIAARLGLKEGTVKIHLHHIYRKLDIHGRHALVALALSRGTRSTRQ